MRALGRQIPHSNKIAGEVCARFSQNCEYRYSLDLQYVQHDTERTETVSVILKNPSSADTCAADTTIRRVEEYVYRHFRSAARLIILNLFAFRATFPRDLKTKITRDGTDSVIGIDNDAAIKSNVAESNHVILAWGAHSGIQSYEYRKRIEHVAGLLDPDQYCVWHIGSLTRDKYPRHALAWSYRDEKQCFTRRWR